MDMDKENVVQAVVLMDMFNKNFTPVTDFRSTGLLQIAGTHLINYVLQSLAYGGVAEVILFCCEDGQLIKEYVSQCTDEKMAWSTMEIHVMISDSCNSIGDVMREIDAAGIVRGYFILTTVNTITNVPFAALLEQHKQTCKKDKGAAMTLVYKKLAWQHPLISCDKSTFLAADANTQKILVHKRYKPRSAERTIDLPLPVVLSHSEIKLHHNLVDANIALCSPSVPPLFSDNFDFQTKDDLINGILINEDILASSLYHIIVKGTQYAATISNWKTYQTISRDILHRWVEPLSIDAVFFSPSSYRVMDKHITLEKTANLSRSCTLGENVMIGANATVNSDAVISNSVIGDNCDIGKNVVIEGSHLMKSIVVEDNCKISNSFIGEFSVVEKDSVIENGSICARKVKVTAGSHLNGSLVPTAPENNEKLPLVKSTSENTEWENESSGSGGDEFIGFAKVWSDSESCYSSDDSDESSIPNSPIPEDTNIFLQEVIDSLARGYEEKSKCDYLILEINSSRYAYNIQLHEVNFFVVRALLSIPVLAENKNVLATVKDILKYFRPILANYIKTKSSVMDCLRAVEDSCIKCEWLEGKCGQIIHLLYEADVVDEDSLLEWQKDLEENESPIVKQTSLVKFFEWLEEASEESDDSE